jgi:hypothetical protein
MRGILLNTLGRHAEALVDLDNVIAIFGAAQAPDRSLYERAELTRARTLQNGDTNR